jgi:membrane fusion protein, multidrug efflux system
VLRPVNVIGPKESNLTQENPTLGPDSVAEQQPSLRRTDAATAERSEQKAALQVRSREPPKAKKPRPRVPVWTLVVGVTLVGAAAYIYVPSLYIVETDDAAIQADTVSVVPKVAAYVSALHVTDNSSFSAGQLLVELDPRDFEAAVNIVAANLQSAQTAESVDEAKLAEQDRVNSSAEANLEGDRGTLAFAKQQLDRYSQLAKEDTGTIERAQQAQSDFAERHAVLERDTATLAAARAQSEVLRSQVEQAKANVAHAQAAVNQANLNLSYTKIYASTAGTVARRTVQVGDFVQPGQTLFYAVPDQIYVIANFKETQLTRMQTGQAVVINVDASPNHELRGHIDSFQRGTGSNFALLPPENATGNFVKIIQRVPVKILIDDFHNVPLSRLGPGMSIETTVVIRPPPRWLAWLIWSASKIVNQL